MLLVAGSWCVTAACAAAGDNSPGLTGYGITLGGFGGGGVAQNQQAVDNATKPYRQLGTKSQHAGPANPCMGGGKLCGEFSPQMQQTFADYTAAESQKSFSEITGETLLDLLMFTAVVDPGGDAVAVAESGFLSSADGSANLSLAEAWRTATEVVRKDPSGELTRVGQALQKKSGRSTKDLSVIG